jgi:hypothetical protein
MLPFAILGQYNLRMSSLSMPFSCEIRTSHSCARPSDFWKGIVRSIEALLLLR